MCGEVPGGTGAVVSLPGWLLRHPRAGVALTALMDVFAGALLRPSGAMLCVFLVPRNVKYQSCMINRV